MKLKALALGLLGLFLASCSEDDTKEPVIDTTELAAKWYYVSYVVNGEIIPYQHEICGRDYVEFTDNAEGADTFSSVQQMEGCETQTTVMGEYTLNGNDLTVTIDGQVVNGTITELTANKLVIQTTYDFDGDGTAGPVTETYAIQP